MECYSVSPTQFLFCCNVSPHIFFKNYLYRIYFFNIEPANNLALAFPTCFFFVFIFFQNYHLHIFFFCCFVFFFRIIFVNFIFLLLSWLKIQYFIFFFKTLQLSHVFFFHFCFLFFTCFFYIYFTQNLLFFFLKIVFFGFFLYILSWLRSQLCSFFFF